MDQTKPQPTAEDRAAPDHTPQQIVSTPQDNAPLDPRPHPTRRPKRLGSKQTKKSSLWSTVIVVVSALIMAFVLVTYVFHSYQVDGSSMETTLQNGNRLIVWKVPRTIARITGHAYIPNRGDVIIFSESGLSGYGQSDNTKQLVKRVIGLPGDHLVVKDGTVTIYNKEHPDGFDPDKTLPYGKDIPETTGEIDVTIKKDHLFVMGDNRPDSLDSRMFGQIDANQVIGKLVLRISPISEITKF